MKKKVLKRMFSVLLAGTMMATVLTGCGNDGGNTTSGDSQQSTPQESSAQPSGDDAGTESESQGETGQSDEWIADREIVLHAYVDDIYNALPDDQRAYGYSAEGAVYSGREQQSDIGCAVGGRHNSRCYCLLSE